MGKSLTDIIVQLTGLINITIGIAAGVALFFFFWGIFRAFGKTDNVEKRAEARQAIVWSLVALFVVVSLGGIIAVFSETFPDLRGGGGGGGVGTAGVPGTSGQTNTLFPTNGSNGTLNVIPGGRTIGPSDIAP